MTNIVKRLEAVQLGMPQEMVNIRCFFPSCTITPLAEIFAEIEGKLAEFEAGKELQPISVCDIYMCVAEEVVDRLYIRGFKITKIGLGEQNAGVRDHRGVDPG